MGRIKRYHLSVLLVTIECFFKNSMHIWTTHTETSGSYYLQSNTLSILWSSNSPRNVYSWCVAGSFRQQVTSVMNMLTVATAWFSDDTAIRYVLPVLWMTSCLPTVGQAKATRTDRILNQGHHRGRSLMFTIALFRLRFLRATNNRIWKYFFASLINLALS